MQRWLHIAGCIYAAIRIYSCVQSPSPNNLIILHPHVCAKIFRHGKLQEFRITFKNSISVSHPLLQRSVNNNAYIYLLMFRYSVRKIWANFCSIVWNGKSCRIVNNRFMAVSIFMLFLNCKQRVGYSENGPTLPILIKSIFSKWGLSPAWTMLT